MPVTAMKAKNAVESLRDIVQDLLVPEIKSIKLDIDRLRAEMNAGDESIRTEMRLLHDQTMQAFKFLDEKMNTAMEVSARLAVLEDRIKRS